MLDPAREIAFPESVVQMLRGDLGQPPGGFPPALQKKVLKGATPLTERPGRRLPPADLDGRARPQPSRSCRGRSTDERARLLPDVPEGLRRLRARARRCTATPTVLPTPVFFYGLAPGEEITVELERGKTLIVRYLAISEPHEDGTRTVFFELNGQPRSVRVADRTQAAGARAAAQGRGRQPEPRRRADAGPGRERRRRGGRARRTRAAAAVDRGDEDGDRRTPSATGEVAEVLVRAGQAVEAHDLLVTFK